MMLGYDGMYELAKQRQADDLRQAELNRQLRQIRRPRRDLAQQLYKISSSLLSLLV